MRQRRARGTDEADLVVVQVDAVREQRAPVARADLVLVGRAGGDAAGSLAVAMQRQRESLAVWLGEDGYPVDTAASGAEAIERAKVTYYALLLLDLQMPPGIDGIESVIHTTPFSAHENHG